MVGTGKNTHQSVCENAYQVICWVLEITVRGFQIRNLKSQIVVNQRESDAKIAGKHFSPINR
jgi:hypothetical protein